LETFSSELVLILLGAVSVVALIIDGLTTGLILRTGGRELNPILLSLMKMLGQKEALVASRVIGCLTAVSLVLASQVLLACLFSGSVLFAAVTNLLNYLNATENRTLSLS